MSDVSGIPYMGPMGVGNLYAPLFPASGMSTPSAAQINYSYAPQEAYGQNVINNLYTGGGFGAQTDYYSGLGAAYSRASGSSNPYGVFSDAGGSGGGASPYHTTPDVWSQGASGFSYPGAGGINWDMFSQPASPYQTSPNVFSSGLGGGASPFQYGGAGLDWSNLFQAPQAPSSSGFNWSTLFGGGGAPQQQQQQPSNFGSLFGQGAGGMYASRPSSEDQTAGWGNAPTAMPSSQKLLGYEPQQWPEAQQQPTNYGSLFGQGVGGSATDQRAGENTVADPNRATYGGYGQGGATSALPGYMADNTLPAELRPSAAPEAGSRTYDFAPMFEGGGGGGLGTGGTESQLFGGREGSLGGSAFAYNPYATETQPSADDMAAQARARLADIIDPAAAETAKTVEAPVVADGEAVPLPRERPAGADAPRPPGDIQPQDLTYLQGKGPGDLKGVNAQFAKAMREFAREYNASQGDYSMALRSGLRSAGQGFHTSGEAADFNLIDRRNGERLTDYQTRDPVVFKAYQDHANQFHSFLEKNYPDLAADHRWGGYFWNGGPGGYGSQDIMHHDLGGNRIGMGGGSWKGGLNQQSADAYGLPTGGGFNTPQPKFTFDWSNAPIKDAPPMQLTYKSADGTSLYQIAPDGSHIPVPIGKGMNETTEYDPFRGTSTFTAPTEQRPGVNQGQNVTPPPAEIPDPRVSSGGFNALDAAANVPKGPSGVEKAQTFLNRPVESILQQYAPQHLTAAGFALDIKQPLREALKGPLGGQILEGLQPRVGDLGLTRTDLAKAIANPAARFGGDFGSSGGDELPTPGAFTPYPGFRESANFENRSGETPGFFSGLADAATNKGRDIADLFGSKPEPDAMSRSLGFDDIMTTPFTPETETAPEIAAAPPTRADLAAAVSASNNGFSRYSDEGYGTSTGRSPPVTLSPEHMRTMEEIESHQNPRLHDPGSSYKGLYQLSDKEFRKYGGTGSIFDAEQNTKAASAKMYAEGQRAQDILGRELSPVEQYMVHQQGLAGTLSHLANPDQPAWKSFQQASQWSDARAKTAIWGNLSNNQKAQFGNDVNSITSRDFINLWTTMYYQKMVESGLSPGGLSDLPQ